MLPLARMEKVIIVGSGCAGLTAAIYAARANLSPLVLEGRQPGGQLSTTTMVENFPGFPEGIDGPQLILNMHQQAEKFGARFSYSEATDFEMADDHLRLEADDEWLETQALIIASGASARYLGLENEEKLIGHGLTSCATCDGAFYRNVPVCVVGGGDSAAEEALFLTRFASKVYLIHRRDQLRASKIMADRVLAAEKIEPIWNTVVTRYIPDDKGEMSAVELRNVGDERGEDLARGMCLCRDRTRSEHEGVCRQTGDRSRTVICSLGTWPKASIPESLSRAMSPIASTSRRLRRPGRAARRRSRRRNI